MLRISWFFVYLGILPRIRFASQNEGNIPTGFPKNIRSFKDIYWIPLYTYRKTSVLSQLDWSFTGAGREFVAQCNDNGEVLFKATIHCTRYTSRAFPYILLILHSKRNVFLFLICLLACQISPGLYPSVGQTILDE